jgi:hypothetical protein
MDERDDYADPDVPVLSDRQVRFARLLLVLGFALGSLAWLVTVGRP